MTSRDSDGLPWADRHSVQVFLEGVHARDHVSGLTHAFYRYPARFSPLFVRGALLAFTRPGDVVLDPFMGGATTIVEARALGRLGIGLDINALAYFVARAKTSVLTESDLRDVRRWTKTTVACLNVRRRAAPDTRWADLGYHRNIDDRQTWPLRRCLELALERLHLLDAPRQRLFVRALLLRTAQWALDCRKELPTAPQFRAQILVHLEEMVDGARAYRDAARAADRASDARGRSRVILLHRSVEGLENSQQLRGYGAPRLVLTSPPYPGVHVMYHRWQVRGRKETPAPFWIADSLDGNGLSYYTLGDRQYPDLKTYFDAVRRAFTSISKLADSDTLFVQMVAFSEPTWQLPKYLSALQAAGLTELRGTEVANTGDGRVWRTVPHRRWYADQRGPCAASKEVVLFHRRSS